MLLGFLRKAGKKKSMEGLADKKIVIVSNREPYSLKKGRLQKTVGGLVSALDPLMQATKGVWIASGPKGDKMDGPHSIQVPPESPSYTLRLVPLSSNDMEGYYNGYSNRFLWPLCHIALDRVYLTRSYWRSYSRVNRLFARAVAEEAPEGSIIWLQDYHLALAAAEIRALRPGAFISLFWHIPWPPHAVFRICPQKKEILEGLLANDLLGFQLPSFMQNFMTCAERELGCVIDPVEGGVRHKGRITRLRTFPISVDFGWFEAAAASPEAESFITKFLMKRDLGHLKLGLSVNRLDYTKGVIKCLEAVELFFTKYPRYRRKFTLIKVAVPTRKVEPFLSYMERVERKVESINRRFGSEGWRPVEYIHSNLSHTELAALYRRADLAVISSVYDGMNLVAKEFIASQLDLTGNILISEFAGASEEIPGVTVINPYDTEACADAMKAALEMDPEERKNRLVQARAHVRKHDIYHWVEDIFSAMQRIQDEQIPSEIRGGDAVALKR